MQALEGSTPDPVLTHAIDDRLYLNITDRCTRVWTLMPADSWPNSGASTSSEEFRTS